MEEVDLEIKPDYTLLNHFVKGECKKLAKLILGREMTSDGHPIFGTMITEISCPEGVNNPFVEHSRYQLFADYYTEVSFTFDQTLVEWDKVLVLPLQQNNLHLVLQSKPMEFIVTTTGSPGPGHAKGLSTKKEVTQSIIDIRFDFITYEEFYHSPFKDIDFESRASDIGEYTERADMSEYVIKLDGKVYGMEIRLVPVNVYNPGTIPFEKLFCLDDGSFITVPFGSSTKSAR